VVDVDRLSPLQPGDWEWQRNAACRAMGSAVFFHPTDERDPARSQRIARAQAICHSCAVIIDCLAYALRVREPYGIWGGLSENDRASLLGLRSLRYPGPARLSGIESQSAAQLAVTTRRSVWAAAVVEGIDAEATG
jgi:WhiB family redox-sensing transcriptional regulator